MNPSSAAGTVRVALPLLCDDWTQKKMDEAVALFQQHARHHAQLIVYPESCSGGDFTPPELVQRAVERAQQHGIPVVYGGWLVENDDNQIAGVFAFPRSAAEQDGTYLYRKHTQSPRLAFDNPDWISSFESAYLRAVPWSGRQVGLTLCHDQTVSLLQRSLVRRGADLIINPSYGHVIHSKWALWLKSRAIENGVPVLSTMFSAAKSGRPGYVVALGPRGEDLPLEFVPVKPRAKSFTAHSSKETTARADGFYLARVPKALSETDVPPVEEGRGERIVLLGGTRAEHVVDRSQMWLTSKPWSIGRPGNASAAIPLGDRTIVAVLVGSAEIFQPETVARALLRAENEHAGVTRPFFVLVNAWSRLPDDAQGDALRTIAAARALEHACVTVLVGVDGNEPLEIFGSTRYRVSRRIPPEGGILPLELNANALQSGGPGWFFSRRSENDFSQHRLAYEALLRSCESGQAAGAAS